MRLFIDDIRQPPDDSWHLCRTVQSAIKAIHQFSEEITDISFDHDISHQVGIGVGSSRPMPCSETFQSVAHYLGVVYQGMQKARVHGLEHVDPWPLSVTIHSANPTGAREIYNILNKYDLVSEVAPLPQANRLELTL